MEEKLHSFQTVALVAVSGQFHAVVALLSGGKNPTSQEVGWEQLNKMLWTWRRR
jgi:hypothetical protein